MRSNTNFIEKDFNENDNKVWKSISENNQEKCISGRDHTDLFKKGVKFLNGSILITTYLKIHKKTENITEWSIRFFVGSPHERCLCICVDNSMSETGNTKGDNANKKSTYSYSSAKQASAKVFQRDTIGEEDNELSQYLRGSKTYKLSDATEYSEGTLIAALSDTAAILTINSMKGMKIRFERLILLQALALAYRDVIDDLVFRQTKAVLKINSLEQSASNLETLREEIVRFEAAFVFKTPLHDDSQHEVSAFWKQCERALGVNTRIEELTSQNRSVYELLRARADGKAEKARQKIEDLDRYRDKKQSLRTALYGILIGVIGVVVTLVEPPFEWDQVLGFIGNFTKTLTSKF
ncbi:MAG: hypothetical protein P8Q29_03120 [Tateyamaria sp.]|nr:hypothetical protein [Tateyamaria sp.]